MKQPSQWKDFSVLALDSSSQENGNAIECHLVEEAGLGGGIKVRKKEIPRRSFVALTRDNIDAKTDTAANINFMYDASYNDETFGFRDMVDHLRVSISLYVAVLLDNTTARRNI